jgi:hypothetical protein
MFTVWNAVNIVKEKVGVALKQNWSGGASN